MKKLYLIAAILITLPAVCQGAVYYVDPSCTENNGNGLSFACATTPGGAGAFNTWTGIVPVAGNYYLQKAGETWAGKLTIFVTGTVANPITYGAYGTGGAITTQKAVIDATGQTQGITGSGKEYINVSDFSIIGNPTNACVAVYSNASRVATGVHLSRISCSGSAGNCIGVTHSSPVADYPGYATDVIIDGADVTSCGQHGIAVVGPYDGAIIRNSTASNVSLSVSGWGIYLGTDSVKYQADDDAWTDAGGGVWTAAKRSTIDVENVMYSSATLGEMHWLTEDAGLASDYTFTHDATTVSMRLPAGVTPNTGCGCSTVIQYDHPQQNGVITESTCSDVSGGDGVCIGADHGTINSIISKVTTHDTAGPGIAINISNGATIEYSTLLGCGNSGDDCLSVSGTKSGSEVDINHVTIAQDVSGLGIVAGGETGSTVNVTNSIVDGGTVGVDTKSTGYGSVLASYNFLTATTDIAGGVTDSGNNSTVDPKLTTTGKLKENSPAREACPSTTHYGSDCGAYTTQPGLLMPWNPALSISYNPGVLGPGRLRPVTLDYLFFGSDQIFFGADALHF